MVKTIVITVEGSITYQFGSDKSVEEVLEEIEAAERYYLAAPTCAIKKDKIISVEYFESEEEAHG